MAKNRKGLYGVGTDEGCMKVHSTGVTGGLRRIYVQNGQLPSPQAVLILVVLCQANRRGTPCKKERSS